MNGWMDGRVGRCLDGWTEGWMDGLSTFSYFYSHKDLFDLVLSLLCYQVKFFQLEFTCSCQCSLFLVLVLNAVPGTVLTLVLLKHTVFVTAEILQFLMILQVLPQTVMKSKEFLLKTVMR